MIKSTSALATAVVAAALVSCATPPPEPPSPAAEVTSQEVPEPFWDFNPSSNYAINYGDVEAVLNSMVVDVGRSDRDRLPATRASTGTRLSTKVRRQTANEGNRFRFEEFKDNEEYKQILHKVRRNLEQIPDQIPLKEFSREEQLAYWLNLYNITILEQLVGMYPERNLKKELTGKNSILSKKVLNVEGIPLSLDDIQHTILRWNYDDNPLVIYGLYQGNIGGPNIRKWAYTGETVYKDLKENAEEFINSNRGTYSKGGKDFHVSSFYARNRGYFGDMDTDLRGHLMNYIEGAQRQQLQQAERLVADINDWSITDLSGGEQQVVGSFAHNPAAMLGAVSSTQPGDDPGTVIGTGFTMDSVTTLTEDPAFSRFNEDTENRLLRVESNNQSVVKKKAGEAEPSQDEVETRVKDEIN